MLYLNGDDNHAVQFMTALPFIDEEHARGTLVHAMGFWFLLALCERRQFETASQLAKHPLLASHPSTASAYKACFMLSSARYAQAIEIAAKGLDLPSATIASEALLRYVLAQAYLRSGNQDRAIYYAEQLMNNRESKPSGLLHYLKRNAWRAFAYACSQTGQSERLQEQLSRHDLYTEDPYVLNALAIIHMNAHRPGLALEVLKRAQVLLPLSGEDGLRESIKLSLAQLQKE